MAKAVAVKEESKTLSETWTGVRVRDDYGKWIHQGYMDPDADRAEYCDPKRAAEYRRVAGWYRTVYVLNGGGFQQINETDIRLSAERLVSEDRKKKLPPKRKAKGAPPPKRMAAKTLPKKRKTLPPKRKKKLPPRRS